MLELDVAEARKLASQMRRARQLRMSFGDDAAGVRETPAEPVMLKVFIDQEVRTLLKLAARERRGRVVLDAADPTLTGLIAALEARFPIGAVPYRLQARWQRRVAPLPAPHEAGHGQAGRLRESLSVDGDAAVARLLDLVSSEDAAIRLELHVLMSSRTLVKGEHASPGLQALVAASVEWCMVSLYDFKPMPDAVAVAELLQREWGRMGILGRTYVAAAEGINAQLAVPDQVLPALEGQVHAVAALQGVRLNVDARREPMLRADGSPGRRPFHGLHVRVRPQIVADGLPPSLPPSAREGQGHTGLDWSDCGGEVAPLEWHRRLMAASAAAAAAAAAEAAAAAAGRDSMSPDAETGERRVVVLDCRNGYESDVG